MTAYSVVIVMVPLLDSRSVQSVCDDDLALKSCLNEGKWCDLKKFGKNDAMKGRTEGTEPVMIASPTSATDQLK